MKLRNAMLGAALVLAQLGTAAVSHAQSRDGYNRVVRIVNDTRYTMTRFYASNKDTKDWEEDIFGRDVLGAWSSIDINIDDGTGYCIYDLKAVFSDGDEVVRWGYNVCEGAKWRIHE